MIKLAGISLSLAIAAAMLLPTGAHAAGHKVAAVKKAKIDGKMLFTDAKGHTLYTFDKDKAGVSNCNDGCAVKWPPVMAKAKGMKDGHFKVITRKDGGFQWAYKGKALYTWFKDTKAGQTSGDGVKGVWHTARP